ncbi:MAG TPA: hypothetical protein VIL38_08340, partial [Thermaerobacter sp.]
GATHVVYEGALDFPDPGRFYRMIQQYRVNKVFTAPTALRMLSRAGAGWPQKFDLRRRWWACRTPSRARRRWSSQCCAAA